jgi:hypothetical protein
LQAQWGERNGSAGSNSDDSLSAVDNFFEDDSLGESNSSESGDEGTSTPPPGGGIYDTYFGGDAWKNAVGDKLGFSGSPTRRQTSESELSNISKMRPFGGASLDMLAPVVRVTHSYDALVLNNQSSRLAMEWELGDWNLHPVEGGFVAGSDPNRTAEAKEELIEEYEERSFHAQITPPRLGKLSMYCCWWSPRFFMTSTVPTSCVFLRTGSIHRRHLIPPSRVQQPTLPRIMSDPNMNKGARRQTPKNMNFRQDEPGVHGGEYSVRPNMEESMTFLRKLFTHQQGGGAFPTLLSPPDSPQCKFSATKFFVSITDH